MPSKDWWKHARARDSKYCSSQYITLTCLMQLFADWGVDYLKMDGCFADPLTFDEGYPTVTRALNESGRHIVFSCSWPAYQVWGGMKVNLSSNQSVVMHLFSSTNKNNNRSLFSVYQPNYQLIAKHCNLWRNYNDIQVRTCQLSFKVRRLYQKPGKT